MYLLGATVRVRGVLGIASQPCSTAMRFGDAYAVCLREAMILCIECCSVRRRTKSREKELDVEWERGNYKLLEANGWASQDRPNTKAPPCPSEAEQVNGRGTRCRVATETMWNYTLDGTENDQEQLLRALRLG